MYCITKWTLNLTDEKYGYLVKQTDQSVYPFRHRRKKRGKWDAIINCVTLCHRPKYLQNLGPMAKLESGQTAIEYSVKDQQVLVGISW